MSTKTITPNGNTWPASFKSVQNLESYDAADDEEVAQVLANATDWLRERICKVQGDYLKAMSQTVTGDTNWHDTQLWLNYVNLQSSDILRVRVQFNYSIAGTAGSQLGFFRIKWTDDDGDRYSSAPVRAVTAPNGLTEARHMFFMDSITVTPTGGAGIFATLQASVNAAAASIIFSTNGQIWTEVQRNKADDLL